MTEHPLKIEEKKCPKCGSKRLVHQPLGALNKIKIIIPTPDIETDIESVECDANFYRCEKCERFLYSTEEL